MEQSGIYDIVQLVQQAMQQDLIQLLLWPRFSTKCSIVQVDLCGIEFLTGPAAVNDVLRSHV